MGWPRTTSSFPEPTWWNGDPDNIDSEPPDYREPPYPWCHTPRACIQLGYCPRDPNCGE